MSKPNDHITKRLPENLLASEINKTKIEINRLICLGLSISQISNAVMYGFWYDYIKPKYQDKANLCI